ncbi:hypothetical protein M0655_14815 [Gordonia amicalis]|uniref:hypothetical protein n=1 Tax=Gordonia amicalis TaxID=89053 RepID=UPI00200B467C|nr:hypothetical protein [Gordonia amicalis]UPW16377.1 hypothetical protein M0655_14815 [Gordonia amicalis]
MTGRPNVPAPTLPPVVSNPPRSGEGNLPAPAQVPTVPAPSGSPAPTTPAASVPGPPPAPGAPATGGSAAESRAESGASDASAADESAVLMASPQGPSGPQALPGESPDTVLTGVKKFLIGVAPGGLLLLGAVALFGSGSFLDSLRSLRS